MGHHDALRVMDETQIAHLAGNVDDLRRRLSHAEAAADAAVRRAAELQQRVTAAQLALDVAYPDLADRRSRRHLNAIAKALRGAT